MESPQHVYAIDTETANMHDPVPLEVAMLALTDLPEAKVRFVIDERFNPGRDIEYGALAAHGILPEEVIACPMFSTFKPPVEFDYAVGHNVDFDLEALYGGADKIPGTIRRICTLALSRWAWPDVDAHKLAAMMYVILGQTKETRDLVKDSHGAMVDAYNCLRIVRAVADFQKVETWEELWKLSEHARMPIRMTFGKHGPKKGEKGMLLADLPAGYRRWLLNLDDLDPYLRKALMGVVGPW